MTKFRKITFLGFIVTVLMTAQFFILSPHIAFACSCPGMPYPSEQSFNVAKAVFSGRVLSVEIDEGFDPYPLTENRVFPHRKVQIQVLESWKGINETSIILTTGLSEEQCGIDFKEGEEYLIYAHDGAQYQTELGTGICQRTKLLAQAQEELEFLSSDTAPLVQEPDPDTTIIENQDELVAESNNDTTRVIFLGIGALAVVLFLLIRFFMKRRK